MRQSFMARLGHIDSHLAMEFTDLNVLYDKEWRDTQLFTQSQQFSSQFEGKCKCSCRSKTP